VSVLHLKPSLTETAAVELARDLFGVEGTAVLLPGERDQNVRVDVPDGRRFVLKIANASEDAGLLEAQHLALAAAGPLSPKPVTSRAGRAIESAQVGDRPLLVRLLTWLDGRPMGTVARRSPALLESLGRAVAQVDEGLARVDHPALRREFSWDLALAPQVLAAGPAPDDAVARALVAHALALHAEHVAPRADRLRRQAIHNDANDYNVLVGGGHDPGTRCQQVVGLLDFGDMVWSARVHDLAVAAAYALLGQDDAVEAIAAVTRGYHGVLPLEADELAALFPLVLLRLALSVHHAALQSASRPDDPYLAISQAPIRAAAPALLAMHPRLAHYVLRHACGVAPVPHAPVVVAWLRSHRGEFAPVLGRDLSVAGAAVPVDLSTGSALVTSDPAGNAPQPMARRLAQAIGRAAGVADMSTGRGDPVGVGGYDEARVLYTTPAFQGTGALGESRTVHLGIDLTAPAGTPVHAPFDGVVHGFENAATRLDYGPVIVLRHDQAGTPFYTLYGHLSRTSLDGRRVGQRVARGDRLGYIGAPPDNGDWWPHLHFQVVTDMLDVPCNVNGSARPSQREVWKSLCPDPNLVLGVPDGLLPRRRSTGSLLASRRAHVGANVRLSYRHPLHIVRGWMQYLFDVDGRRYLDAYNNVPHVGHAHPAVVAAVQDQLALLNTNTRYLQDVHVEYVEQLLATFPAPLSVCYLTASGSEATELALRLARARTGGRDLLVLDAAYHGHTTTAIDISPYKHEGPGGEGAPRWVHKTALPDVYRGAYRATDPEAGPKYAAEVGARIDDIQRAGRRLCGYLAETCPSVGGQLMLPSGYLAEVYRLVRAAGGVAIADEVQTGLGRIGTHFWAFEAHGVVPDIVVLGKPLGNGYPMGGVVTTPEVAAAFDNGMEFFSTFGGSSAACAAGLATLRATLDEGLMAHARDVGERLLASLRALQDRHALVGDVRGSGLFLGIELVSDREALVPAADEAAFLVNRLRELGVLTGTDGPAHNVIKIRGPMPLTADDADLLAGALARALAELDG
jgi:4-aminobutyrate aminotransferase-like enzyme/Ser/Thr protein kinase RdoA (MazF antagonist)